METKYLRITVAFAFITIMLSSCWFLGPTIRGNGNVTEEVRELSGFDEIEVSRGMNVYITQGSPEKVVVVADNNLHDVIITDVDGDVLKIYVDAIVRESKEMKVMVTVENLTDVSTSSGANVYSQNPIKTDDIEIEASSGSNITMEFNADFLKAQCSSGSNIILSGYSRESELKGSSGSNLKAEGLKSDNCKIKVSSGSNVYATVEKELTAKASSGGNVVYYGEPNSTNIDSSSGGSVNKR
jgi:hypothetical protein